MKQYKSLNKWNYGELEVQEIGTEKRYTLTQRKTLSNEDFFMIARTVAVPYGIYEGEDDYPYIYEVSWMGKANPGSVLYMKYIDEETMVDFYKNFAIDILRGELYEDRIEGWFKGRECA